MQKRLGSLFLVAIITLIASCGKEKNTVTPKTKTQLISQGTWKFSSATSNGTDVSAFIQACQKDNITTFVSTGTGTIDEGASKCNGADPQTRSFTWSFQTNETVLMISSTLFTGGSGTFNLVSLSETQLVVSQTITVSGTPQNVVITFVHG